MGKITSLIFLVAAAALLVITYFFPFFTYNIGSYKGEMLGQDVAVSFNFSGECTFKIDDDKYEGKYEIKDGAIIITEIAGIPSNFSFSKLNFTNSYTLVPEYTGDLLEVKLVNYVGIGFTAIYAFVGFISRLVFVIKLVK